MNPCPSDTTVTPAPGHPRCRAAPVPAEAVAPLMRGHRRAAPAHRGGRDAESQRAGAGHRPRPLHGRPDRGDAGPHGLRTPRRPGRRARPPADGAGQRLSGRPPAAPRCSTRGPTRSPTSWTSRCRWRSRDRDGIRFIHQATRRRAMSLSFRIGDLLPAERTAPGPLFATEWSRADWAPVARAPGRGPGGPRLSRPCRPRTAPPRTAEFEERTREAGERGLGAGRPADRAGAGRRLRARTGSPDGPDRVCA